MPRHVQVAIGIGLVIVLGLAVAAIATGGHTGSGGQSSAEYDQALEHCQSTAGVAWLAQHPSANPNDSASVTSYAAAINRCLVDTMHVDPKYLPNKPVAP